MLLASSLRSPSPMLQACCRYRAHPCAVVESKRSPSRPLLYHKPASSRTPVTSSTQTRETPKPKTRETPSHQSSCMLPKLFTSSFQSGAAAKSDSRAVTALRPGC